MSLTILHVVPRLKLLKLCRFGYRNMISTTKLTAVIA